MVEVKTEVCSKSGARLTTCLCFISCWEEARTGKDEKHRGKVSWSERGNVEGRKGEKGELTRRERGGEEEEESEESHVVSCCLVKECGVPEEE